MFLGIHSSCGLCGWLTDSGQPFRFGWYKHGYVGVCVLRTCAPGRKIGGFCVYMYVYVRICVDARTLFPHPVPLPPSDTPWLAPRRPAASLAQTLLLFLCDIPKMAKGVSDAVPVYDSRQDKHTPTRARTRAHKPGEALVGFRAGGSRQDHRAIYSIGWVIGSEEYQAEELHLGIRCPAPKRAPPKLRRRSPNKVYPQIRPRGRG